MKSLTIFGCLFVLTCGKYIVRILVRGVKYLFFCMVSFGMAVRKAFGRSDILFSPHNTDLKVQVWRGCSSVQDIFFGPGRIPLYLIWS